mmetsp:Transcript_888/g.1409  ORF Transcript_888/g.1409 Transcript_888/m.1409 type:complete len:301 (-) Transcript_888:747-1649(-)|eukprot:CAMPEP_0195282430 /NCGR_PEP_ID=MMETSP0707-20130614/1302_1 /TAXON_ID=33640 /ORGANISM="Asterionellopsis glacialis, Strain CCMP134" /LENGTH=300 /DNA_ID=CAMNT_0040341397 /DNA_START=233 /DNA_END=1135 /DNA_ORIENTATION=+
MPQGSGANKSSGKKKGRPKYQNEFAFKHNLKSKKTDKILNSPNIHVCRRCHEKIEWRKKYRKYKPLTQPAKCNTCHKRNIKSAYHTLCTDCTTSDAAKRKLVEYRQQEGLTNGSSTTPETPSAEESDPSDSPIPVQEEGDIQSESNNGTSAASRKAKKLDIANINRVCAMCAKDTAMKHEDDEDMNELVADTSRMKLRERRGVERRLAREKEEAKQKAKEERRAAREDDAIAKKSNEPENHAGDSRDDHQKGKQTESNIEDIPEGVDEEEDPFLKAVGGSDKLLTGEAYQEMLLGRAQQN